MSTFVLTTQIGRSRARRNRIARRRTIHFPRNQMQTLRRNMFGIFWHTFFNMYGRTYATKTRISESSVFATFTHPLFLAPKHDAEILQESRDQRTKLVLLSAIGFCDDMRGYCDRFCFQLQILQVSLRDYQIFNKQGPDSK